MEARKVIGVICAIYAVLMAISIIVGFVNPYGRTNFVMKQVGGVVGLVVSSTVAWYMLKEEKVVPLDPSAR
jgi:succinate-acetate transporter protein